MATFWSALTGHAFSGGSISVNGNSSVGLMAINGQVTINGKTYRGQTVEVRNGRVYIDGALVTDDADAKPTPIVYAVCNITVTGDVSGGIEIKGSGDVTVQKDVVSGDVRTMSGSIKVGGSLKAGSAHTMSGDIRIEGDCAGNATSMSGDVKVRRDRKKVDE